MRLYEKRGERMEIYDVSDVRFQKYGRVIDQVDFSGLTEAMKETPVPEGVVYEPCEEKLMALPVAEEIKSVCFGEMPIQIGYCNGHNQLLNAVEYHRSSEINVAVTDAILILGLETDVEKDFTYDTSKMEAFRIPAKTAVEIYATTLHYAPCHVNQEGFQVAVILPEGTNYPLKKKHADGEDALLAAVNKWLIGHKDGGLPEGSFIGLKGKNLDVSEK